MSFHASILTLFPDMFPGTLAHSLAGSALKDGKWSFDAVDIRSFATDKHRTVDDHVAGGGAGMVLKPDILAKAIDGTSHKGPRLLMSPRGAPLTQSFVRELAQGEGCMIICGRFEGIDQRVIDARSLQEVSVGDYVLSGGEPAALVMLDAIVRLLPGVMGHDQSHAEESFEDGLLEHPHYTKPRLWEGLETPEILGSGDHKAIAAWKHAQREALTKARRPDLYDKYTKRKG
ncbi:tRNA (guanosine(37)-N1)-methyltransferase TrmD [Aestuariivirga litoralis]|uniref:tRNA (guanosine(37)-N1)-methyltransferase TrmD n=1 Tax=Aestuariivirga litoralis TaxID=2650924 RepID=UPI0018C4F4D4|nr:tRNA (guanosine(37)-N1)-methyltransferase TrmD [Aestuariivirga litoralis]MBG1233689.1 tRNA (guanosine(37)-N1)-methyltransferase TrmD [Aestuariivirga litoralis]